MIYLTVKQNRNSTIRTISRNYFLFVDIVEVHDEYVPLSLEFNSPYVSSRLISIKNSLHSTKAYKNTIQYKITMIKFCNPVRVVTHLYLTGWRISLREWEKWLR